MPRRPALCNALQVRSGRVVYFPMSTVAARVRLHRERKRSGAMVLPPMLVRNKHLLAEKLLEAELLDWDKVEDDEAIAQAVNEMLNKE